MTDPPRFPDPARSDLLTVPPRRPPTLRVFPTLRDAWPQARPFTLDGGLERHGFTPGWTALLVGILALLLFVLVSNVIMAVGVVGSFLESGEQPTAESLMEAMAEKPGLVFGGNALGQVVSFALLVWILARMHARPRAPFLRLRRPDPVGLGLAVLGWVVLVPGLFWLGALNQSLPQPTWMAEFERSQMELIESVLFNSDIGAPFLLFTIALTPAVCEELLFRGYLQRQVERSRGLLWSIVLVGLAFGVYHFRLSQVVPLTLLGCYLGYVTWATGSLYSAMLVHLLHNGIQVLVSVYARSSPTLDLEAVENATVPWYLGLASLAAAAGVLVLLRRRRESVAGTAPDAVPVPPAAPASLSDSQQPPFRQAEN